MLFNPDIDFDAMHMKKVGKKAKGGGVEQSFPVAPKTPNVAKKSGGDSAATQAKTMQQEAFDAYKVLIGQISQP